MLGSFFIAAFILCSLLQIAIWWFFPARLLWQRQRPAAQENLAGPSVSVVICARNEAANLTKNLPFVLTQQYPGPVEVCVVDDASTDETGAVLRHFQRLFPHLRVIRLERKTHPGKKQALAAGIAAAQHEWLLLTDADCMPLSERWLSGMLAPAQAPGVVLGYAPLLHETGGLVLWSRFETLFTALQYCSMARARLPFMGVGRNMAIHKSVYQGLEGKVAQQHLPGGDDDLTVNAAAGRFPVYWTLDPDSFTISAAQKRITAWLQQKRRHLSAGLYYRPLHQILLGGYAFTHAGHYGFGLLAGIAAPGSWPLILLAYSLRMGIVWYCWALACQQLQERRLAIWTPLLDGCMALWLGAVAPFLLFFPKKNRW